MKKFIRANRAFLLLIFLCIVFRTTYADWSPVPTSSMEPTLLPGDVVWVDKTSFGPTLPLLNKQLLIWGRPARGDVITFVPPHTDELYVKRVIGVPGDRIRIDGTRIYINDIRLVQETVSVSEDMLIGTEWIDGLHHQFQLSRGLQAPSIGSTITIPQGKYFVMGDYRNNSADSRYWGFVDQKQIMGKVTSIAVSFSRNRPLLARLALPIE
jgi:signal peptidase I